MIVFKTSLVNSYNRMKKGFTLIGILATVVLASLQEAVCFYPKQRLTFVGTILLKNSTQTRNNKKPFIYFMNGFFNTNFFVSGISTLLPVFRIVVEYI